MESSNQHINLKDAVDLILDFNENKNEDEDDETIEQNEIKKLNDYFDKIIDKSKSFNDQIKLLEKEDLKKYFPHKDYDDKELQNLQTCQMRLTKSYLKKYLVIHL